MELLSAPSVEVHRLETPAGVAVVDVIPIRLAHGLDYPSGLAVVLDACPAADPTSFVGRVASIRPPGGVPRGERIADVRDHEVTISFFFEGLKREDVPIGSTITVVD